MRRLLGFLILAGCGDDGGGGGLPDAPVIPDAPDNIDAPTAGLVTLTVAKGATPQVGVRVHFQNADSSVVATATTDTTGIASATMEPGGFVTAIDPFGGGVQGLRDIKTFAGVKPGDNLVLRRRDDTPINFTLLLPTAPSGATYFLFSPCSSFLDVTDPDGSGGVGGPVQLFGCTGPTDFLVLVHDAGERAISSLHKPGITLVEGATLDFTGDTYTPVHDTTWSYENVPPAYGAISVVSLLVDTHGPIFQTFASATPSGGVAMTAPTKTAVVTGPVQVDRSSLFGPTLVTQHVLEWGPPTTAHTTVLNPNILVPDYTSQPVFSVPSHTLSWATDGAGTLPDLTVATVLFDRGATSQFWSWHIAAPHTTSSVAYPVLPADDAILNPIDTDGVFVSILNTARVPGGYDAVRATVLSLENTFAFATGASGQAVIAELNHPK